MAFVGENINTLFRICLYHLGTFIVKYMLFFISIPLIPYSYGVDVFNFIFFGCIHNR
jgi:hypothetical protein